MCSQSNSRSHLITSIIFPATSHDFSATSVCHIFSPIFSPVILREYIPENKSLSAMSPVAFKFLNDMSQRFCLLSLQHAGFQGFSLNKPGSTTKLLFCRDRGSIPHIGIKLSETLDSFLYEQIKIEFFFDMEELILHKFFQNIWNKVYFLRPSLKVFPSKNLPEISYISNTSDIIHSESVYNISLWTFCIGLCLCSNNYVLVYRDELYMYKVFLTLKHLFFHSSICWSMLTTVDVVDVCVLLCSADTVAVSGVEAITRRASTNCLITSLTALQLYSRSLENR